MRASCDALGQLLASCDGDAAGFVSINVDARRFVEPDFAWQVLVDLAARSGQPGNIVLELTEHSRVTDWTMAAVAIHELQRHGVRIAIADLMSPVRSAAPRSTNPS